MGSNISIRKTTDKKLIYNLQTKLFPDDDFYEHKNNNYWIAWKDEKPIGFCIAAIWKYKVLFLARSGVISSQRGNNLQKRLVRVRESFAKKNGIKTIITYTLRDNIPSFVNLIKMNYLIYEPEYPYSEYEAFYFIKKMK